MLKKLMIIILSLLFIISCNNNVSNPNDSSSNGNNNNNNGNEDVFDVNNYTNAYDSRFYEYFDKWVNIEGNIISASCKESKINNTDNILIIPYVGMSHPTTMKYCFIESIIDDTGTPKIIETSEIKTVIFGSHQREDGSYASDTGELYIDFPNYKYNDYGNYKPTRYLMIISAESLGLSCGNCPKYFKF